MKTHGLRFLLGLGIFFPWLLQGQSPEKISFEKGPDVVVSVPGPIAGKNVSSSGQEMPGIRNLAEAEKQASSILSLSGSDFRALQLDREHSGKKSGKQGSLAHDSKWNAPGKLFLSEYAALQAKMPAERAVSVRERLEKTFGLCTKGAPAGKSQADYVPVLLQFRDQAALQAAEALGFIARTRLEKSCTGLFPMRAVEEIGAIEGIEKINVYVSAQPDNDLIRVESKVQDVQENYSSSGLSQAYDGEGVVVGIIDMGFDYTHPTFFADPSDESTYRIKRVWDQQAVSGTAPQGFDYGAEYTTASAILAQEHDHHEGEHHGTHVAGTAAGSGAGTAYKGMAPGSDVVLVSTTMGLVDVLDAIQYIQSYAASVGKPSVINMSLGTPLGPHTGTTALDLAYGEFSTPGNLLVGSAGNSGADVIHAGGDLSASDLLYYGISFDDPSAPVNMDVYDYQNGGLVTLQLVEKSTGLIVSQVAYFMLDGYNEAQQTLYYGQTPVLSVTGQLANEVEYSNLFIQLQPQGEIPEGYVVCAGFQPLYQNTPTRLHAWLQGGTYSTFDLAYLNPGDSRYTHNGYLSASEKILSVAAYTSRSSWTDMNSDSWGFGETVGEICSFSSQGPLVSSIPKPDIAAPGSVILSSGNSYSAMQAEMKVGETERGGRMYPWMAMQGTSMSAPAVTGMVALMLQKNNDLDFYSLKNLLQQTAVKDEQVNAGGINRWGAGKIDILSALQAMEAGDAYQDYYASVRGKTGFELKTALKELIDEHTVLTYSQVRDAMPTTDARADGSVWDMYSSASSAWNWGAESDAEGGGINREHAFPRSWFGGDITPMYTDLFHLYPTDIYVNGLRGNSPFGEVYAPSWTGTSSRVGSSASKGYNFEVFEPADEYKGDFARTYFYMATRYEDSLDHWMTPVLDGSTDYGLAQWAIDMLMAWHEQDPVSEKEVARNEAVYQLQGNRNPFIDNPKWVEEIWGQEKELVGASNLMITEYVSGIRYGQPQRAIEIYNGTGMSVNLAGYCLKFETNGAGGYTDSLPLQGFLMPYSCYVAANSASEDGKLLYADLLDSEKLRFDGNDAVALFYNGVLIDEVGVSGSSDNWGRDQVLRRKTSVTSPSTTYNVEEWLSFNCELTGDFGNHGGSQYNPSTLTQLQAETSNLIIVSYTKALKGLAPASSIADFYLMESGNEENVIAVTGFEVRGKNLELLLQSEMEVGKEYVLNIANLEDQWGLYTGGYTGSVIWDGTGSGTYCETIAQLRSREADGKTEYTLASLSVVTAIGSQRNQMWIQDASGAGILIDDPSGVITTGFAVGEHLRKMSGTLSVYDGALQFTPTWNVEKAFSGMRVEPLELLPEEGFRDERLQALEGRLVSVKDCEFSTTGTFANGYNYTASSHGQDVFVRIHIWNTDLTGSAIPSGEVMITGIVVANNNHYYISPRFLDDLVEKQEVPCQDLAELLARDPDNYTEYTVASTENTITAIDSEQNRFWLQDAAGSAVMVEYPEGLLTGTYAIGDEVSGLKGTLRQTLLGSTVYTLTQDVTPTGNKNEPEPVAVQANYGLATWPSAYVAYQEEFKFLQSGFFAEDSIYTLRDVLGNEANLYLYIHGTGLAGQPIPSGLVKISGISVVSPEGYWYLAPRSMSDISEVEKETVTARLQVGGQPLNKADLRVRMSFYDPFTAALSTQEYRTDKNGSYVFEAYAGVSFSVWVEATDAYLASPAVAETQVVSKGQSELPIELSTGGFFSMEAPAAVLEGGSARIYPGKARMGKSLRYSESLSLAAYSMGSPIGIRFTPEDLAYMNVQEGDTLLAMSIMTRLTSNSIPYRFTLYAGADRSEILLDTAGVIAYEGMSLVSSSFAYGKPIDVSKDLWVVVEYDGQEGDYPYIWQSSIPFKGKDDLVIVDRENPSLDVSFTSIGGGAQSVPVTLNISHWGKLSSISYSYRTFAEGPMIGPGMDFSADSTSVLYDYWQALDPGTYRFKLQVLGSDHLMVTETVSNEVEKEETAQMPVLSIEQNEGGTVSVKTVNAFYDSIDVEEGAQTYGTSLILKAEPDPGMRLVSWMDGRTELVRELRIVKDTTVKATFEAIPTYMFTLQQTTGGSVAAEDAITGEALVSGQRYSERWVRLTAQPDPEYMLKGWSFFDTPESPVGFYLNRDTTVYAEFVEKPSGSGEEAVVSIVQNPGGTLEARYDGNLFSSGETVPVGALLTLTAIAEPTYAIETWWDGTPAVSNTRAVVIGKDTTLSAVFARQSVFVNITQAEGGNIRVLHEGSMVASGSTVPVGAELELSAEPAQGYKLGSWWDGNEESSRTIVAGSEDLAISATFVQELYQLIIPSYEEGTLHVSNYANGQVYRSGDKVEPGTILYLAAEENPGYRFVSWWDGDKSNPRLYPVQGNMTIGAVFRQAVEYTVSISQTEGGLVTVYDSDGMPVQDGSSHEEGSLFSMTAEAAEGYVFVQWWDGYTQPARSRFALESDVEISAEFTRVSDPGEEYLVTIEEPANGTIIVQHGGVPVSSGENLPANAVLTLTAVPADGYAFSQWWDGNTRQERNYVLTAPVTIDAEFEEIVPEYLLTIYQSQGGTVSASIEGEDAPTGSMVPEGSMVALKAEAHTGYVFEKWWDGDTLAERMVEMTRPLYVQASFLKVGPELFEVTIAQAANGSIQVMCEGEEVSSGDLLPEGSTLQLAALADEGYEFEAWWDGETESERSYVLNAPVEISATFVPEVSLEGNALSIVLWPNPSDGFFYVETVAGVQAFVFSPEGRLVYRQDWKESGRKTIDLRGRNAGVYYLHVVKGSMNKVMKLVVK